MSPDKQRNFRVHLEKGPMLARLRNNLFYFFALFPALLYIGSFFAVIVVNLIVYSFTKYSGGLPSEPTFSNYINVITSPEFRGAYVRTALFMLVVTPLQLVTGLFTASLIHKSFKGRGFARGIFLVPLALPALVTASAFYILFAKGGMINSLLMGQYSFFPQLIAQPISYIGSSHGSFVLTALVKVWRDTPASMLILLAGMQSIDASQYEAAESMGANKLQNLFYITIPLLAPSISSVLVLRSIEGWKEYLFPYILSPSFPLISMVIDRYFNQMRDPGMAAVSGLILIVSIVIFSQLLKAILNAITRYLVRV